VDAPRLRTWLRALGALYFFASIAFICLFATGDAGSWRDPKSWPAVARIAALASIVVGCYLPIYWLKTHAPGPETSTRRFAILATGLFAGAVSLMALRAISEPARVAGWAWLGVTILVAVPVTCGIWRQVDRRA
jgi:hypothetical protein